MRYGPRHADTTGRFARHLGERAGPGVGVQDLDERSRPSASSQCTVTLVEGTCVFMHIVHVFDMRDGKIAEEKVFEMRQPVETAAELDAPVELAKIEPWQPGRVPAEVRCNRL